MSDKDMNQIILESPTEWGWDSCCSKSIYFKSFIFEIDHGEYGTKHLHSFHISDNVNHESILIIHHSFTFRYLRHIADGPLPQWGRVTPICVGKLTISCSDNGLLPGRHQAIIWTNAGILLIWHSGTNFSDIWIEIYTFSFQKMHLKMSSILLRPQCVDYKQAVAGTKFQVDG